jgi:hypothetical protein
MRLGCRRRREHGGAEEDEGESEITKGLHTYFTSKSECSARRRGRCTRAECSERKECSERVEYSEREGSRGRS